MRYREVKYATLRLRRYGSAQCVDAARAVAPTNVSGDDRDHCD